MLTREQLITFSDLVSGIFAAHPPVKVTSIKADGDIHFRVSLKCMNLDSKKFINNYSLLCTNYVANLLGEWLVRTNFDTFSDLRTPEEMKNAARAFNHKGFGMSHNNSGQYFEFIFHVSLLDRIDEEFQKINAAAPQGTANPSSPGSTKSKSAENAGQDPFSKLYVPMEIFKQLTEYVIGQDRAVRTLAVRGALHVQKARLIREGKPVSAPNECLLFIGPSGCGKTYLAEQFGKLCQLPFASVSATDITETGYIGLDVEDSLSSLINASSGNYDMARFGVLFVDEIDKKATRVATNSVGRDVSGTSVQQCFLRMMEGCECLVGQKRKSLPEQQRALNTYGVQFIFGGAFSELEYVIRQKIKATTGIGFKEMETVTGAKLDHYLVEALVDYGMIPEWVNRLTGLVLFNQLTVNDLCQIVTAPHGALASLQGLLAVDGLDFNLSKDAIRAIAGYAHETGTMARGLKLVMGRLIEDIVFEGRKGMVQFGLKEVQTVLSSIDGRVGFVEQIFVKTPAVNEQHAAAKAASIA